MNTHLWTPPTAQISMKLHQHQPHLFAALLSLCCTTALLRISETFFSFLYLNHQEANLRFSSRGSTIQSPCQHTHTHTGNHWMQTKYVSERSEQIYFQLNSVWRNQWPLWVLQHPWLKQLHWLTSSFFRNDHESQSLGTRCTFSTVVASSTCNRLASQSLTSNVFYAWLQCAMDYLSSISKRVQDAHCCKTNDSDQVFMSVNTLEMLLVFMHFGCAAVSRGDPSF